MPKTSTRIRRNNEQGPKLYRYDALNAYYKVSDLSPIRQIEVHSLIRVCPFCQDKPVERLWLLTVENDIAPTGMSCDNPACFLIVHKSTDKEMEYLISSRH